MITGARDTWMISMVNLALILFIVWAAAANRHGGDQRNPLLPVRAEPLASFRPEGALSLREWLADQPRDERERLTIVGRYSAGGVATAAQRAVELASEAEAVGRHARVVLEPADGPDLVAVLAFDATGDWHDDCNGTDRSDAAGVSRKDLSCE
jgi:hypothetical protein